MQRQYLEPVRPGGRHGLRRRTCSPSRRQLKKRPLDPLQTQARAMATARWDFSGSCATDEDDIVLMFEKVSTGQVPHPQLSVLRITPDPVEAAPHSKTSYCEFKITLRASFDGIGDMSNRIRYFRFG